MIDEYQGREQTKVKHFILRTYLQELAFKVLYRSKGWSKFAYVDGFSGPWGTRAAGHVDSSFMIAIEVLKDVQREIYDRTGERKTIHCFFSENSKKNYIELESAVAPCHDPKMEFLVEPYHGKFEDMLAQIEGNLTDEFFVLFFIDPTGWSGYPLDALAPHIKGRSREVLINFMYDYINRFKDSPNPKTIESLDPILGGPGWQNRLPPDVSPSGLAVEKLFRDELKKAGKFKYVFSTCIDKPTANRPHFFLTYGTKDKKGLFTFRDVEAQALQGYDKDRLSAKMRKRSERTNINDLFSNTEAELGTYEDIVSEEKKKAETVARALIKSRGAISFDDLCAELCEAFILRETHVKDICVSLQKSGLIKETWAKQKPKSGDMIQPIEKE